MKDRSDFFGKLRPGVCGARGRTHEHRRVDPRWVALRAATRVNADLQKHRQDQNGRSHCRTCYLRSCSVAIYFWKVNKKHTGEVNLCKLNWRGSHRLVRVLVSPLLLISSANRSIIDL